MNVYGFSISSSVALYILTVVCSHYHHPSGTFHVPRLNSTEHLPSHPSSSPWQLPVSFVSVGNDVGSRWPMRVPSLFDWHISLSYVSRLRYPLKHQHFLSFKANAIALHVSHFVYLLLYVSFISNLCVCMRGHTWVHACVYVCLSLCVYVHVGPCVQRPETLGGQRY